MSVAKILDHLNQLHLNQIEGKIMKQKTFTATIQVIPDKFGETEVTVVGANYAEVEGKINNHYQNKAGVTSWEILNIALEKDNEVIV